MSNTVLLLSAMIIANAISPTYYAETLSVMKIILSIAIITDIIRVIGWANSR